MSKEKITYMSVTTPNLDKLKRNLPLVIPYVDEAVIVIGKKCDETVEYLKRFPNVKIVYRPWQDSFRDQYQVGLNYISEGWVNIMDDDEVPSEGMLKSFGNLIEQSRGGQVFDVVEFKAVDVYEDGGHNITDYHRQMFYRWNPSLHYEISLHQCLVGLRAGVRCNEVYYHKKSELGSLRGACRNYWAAGAWADGKDSFEFWHKETGQDPRGNPGSPLTPNTTGTAYPVIDGFRTDSWKQLRELVKEHHPEVEYFHDLDQIIKSGGLHPAVVDWALQNNEDNDKRPHLHEQYAYYKYLKHFGYTK